MSSHNLDYGYNYTSITPSYAASPLCSPRDASAAPRGGSPTEALSLDLARRLAEVESEARNSELARRLADVDAETQMVMAKVPNVRCTDRAPGPGDSEIATGDSEIAKHLGSS